MAQTIVNPTFSNDCRSTMSRPWSHNYWSNWEDHSYRHWQSSSQAPPSFTPDLPAHWKDSDVHYNYDENCLHGYPLLKTIQPTAWSRKRGLHGMDPMQVPLAAVCGYQAREFALRPFSAGRFLGVVPTRTVAEAGFCSQFLKAVREQSVDIDGIAEHLHRAQNPSGAIPSKLNAPI